MLLFGLLLYSNLLFPSMWPRRANAFGVNICHWFAVKETELRIDVIPMAAITHQCPSKLTLHLRVVSSGALGPWYIMACRLVLFICRTLGERAGNGMLLFFIVMTHICSEKLRRSWFPGDLLSIQIDWIFTKRLRHRRLNGLQLRLLSIDPKSKSIGEKSAKKSILLINTNDLIQIEWTRTWERCQSGSAATHHPGQMRKIKAGANLHIFRISAPDSAPFFLRIFLRFSATKHLPISDWSDRTETNQTKPNRTKPKQIGSRLRAQRAQVRVCRPKKAKIEKRSCLGHNKAPKHAAKTEKRGFSCGHWTSEYSSRL